MALSHYMAGRMGDCLTLQIGQEAIPVLVWSIMRPQDHTICALRGMGTAICGGSTTASSKHMASSGKNGLYGIEEPVS